jgi:hypothetical protein
MLTYFIYAVHYVKFMFIFGLHDFLKTDLFWSCSKLEIIMVKRL